MNIEQNFKYLGKCDIQFIKDKLLEIDQDIWKEHSYRQEQYGPHRNTESIELMWDRESFTEIREAKKNKHFDTFEIQKLFDMLKDIYVLEYGDGYFARALLVRLKANKDIKMHKDGGISLSSCHRTHIPIITNSKVTFHVGGENKNLGEGEIWEINNMATHAVFNQSDTDRIHLIIDYFLKNDN